MDFRGRVLLAPLTKGGNLPFRRLLLKHGCEVTMGEMAYAYQVVKRSKSELALLRKHDDEQCFGAQIAASRIDDAVKAGQDRERLKNEGQAYANDVIPRARGTAARLLEEAQGYQAATVSKAEGDASRFRQIVVEYQKAPSVTRDRLYLDMMQSVLGNSSKVMVEPKGGNLLYLPLDRLMQQAGAPAPGSP